MTEREFRWLTVLSESAYARANTRGANAHVRSIKVQGAPALTDIQAQGPAAANGIELPVEATKGGREDRAEIP